MLELEKRASNVVFVEKSARALIEKSDEDTSMLQSQVVELSTRWERVCKLSTDKQNRLQDAITKVRPQYNTFPSVTRTLHSKIFHLEMSTLG